MFAEIFRLFQRRLVIPRRQRKPFPDYLRHYLSSFIYSVACRGQHNKKTTDLIFRFLKKAF